MSDPDPDRFSGFWPSRSGPKRTKFLDFTTMSGQQFRTQKTWEVVGQIWVRTSSIIFNLLCKNMSCLVVKYVDLWYYCPVFQPHWNFLLMLRFESTTGHFGKCHTYSWIEQASPSHRFISLFLLEEAGTLRVAVDPGIIDLNDSRPFHKSEQIGVHKK